MKKTTMVVVLSLTKLRVSQLLLIELKYEMKEGNKKNRNYIIFCSIVK